MIGNIRLGRCFPHCSAPSFHNNHPLLIPQSYLTAGYDVRPCRFVQFWGIVRAYPHCQLAQHRKVRPVRPAVHNSQCKSTHYTATMTTYLCPIGAARSLSLFLPTHKMPANTLALPPPRTARPPAQHRPADRPAAAGPAPDPQRLPALPHRLLLPCTWRQPGHHRRHRADRARRDDVPSRRRRPTAIRHLLASTIRWPAGNGRVRWARPAQPTACRTARWRRCYALASREARRRCAAHGTGGRARRWHGIAGCAL
jgi:hypothetical protein